VINQMEQQFRKSLESASKQRTPEGAIPPQ
jgi:hypothetical protein